jgi:hypothetical protein
MRILETALAHNPEDSTAWFLHAICVLEKKDATTAKRDLRRMVLIENLSKEARHDRVLAIEFIHPPSGSW